MEIIRKSAQGPAKFRVIKPFMWRLAKMAELGETVEMEQADADQFVQIGKVVPVDLPEVAVYVALRDFSLPGRSEKFCCKKLERVELKADDALRLMLDRSVLPEDDGQWRPRNARLKVDGRKEEGLAQKKRDGLDQAEFDQKIWEMTSKGRIKK
jgi:hypothetical protein